MDVLANYGIKDIKFPPFTVHFSTGGDIRFVRNAIESGIRNKTNGEIWLYQLSYESPSRDRTNYVKISEGLPKPVYKNLKVHTLKGSKNGFKYHIGLSQKIITDIANKKSNGDFLGRYLNKLKLRGYDNV